MRYLLLLTLLLTTVYSKVITLDKGFYTSYYDTDYKAPVLVKYTLTANQLRLGNIKRRLTFKTDKALPRKVRSHNYSYARSGYDRGHMASDASFDWSKPALRSVYLLSNAVPQLPSVNRYLWIKAERRERTLALLHDKIAVINVIEYPENPNRIGKDKIAIPSGFYKLIVTPSGTECYYFSNSKQPVKTDKLKQHLTLIR